jgi:hypothetical protein
VVAEHTEAAATSIRAKQPRRQAKQAGQVRRRGNNRTRDGDTRVAVHWEGAAVRVLHKHFRDDQLLSALHEGKEIAIEY